MSEEPNASINELQGEVQRKLGRCILRLQQIERAFKTLAATTECRTSLSDANQPQTDRVAQFSRRTLGQLIGDLTGTFLTDEPSGAPGWEFTVTRGVGNITEPQITTRTCIELTPEEYRSVQRNLTELLEMRNELVHHFIDRFDLFDESGCHAATAHLDHCLAELDRHRLEIHSWSQAMMNLTAEVGEFLQSSEADALFEQGILPDGTGYVWEWTPIVRLLRRAEKQLGTHGWTLLDSAIKFIQANHPEETPRKYNCANWKQLLRKSQQFDIRKTGNLESHRSEIWYRSMT